MPGGKWLISFLLLVGALVGITYFLYLQVWPAVSIKRRFPKEAWPEAYVIPTLREVKIPESDFVDHREFSYSGFKFKTPWTDLVKETKVGQAVNLSFPQDKSLTTFGQFHQPAETLFLELDPEGLAKQKIVDYYGDQVPQQGYDLYELILNSSPDQINVFTPRKEALAKSALVIMKVVGVQPVRKRGAEPKIYSFNLGDIEGFQFNDPKVAGKAFIYFFDARDRGYTLLIKGSQEEIDFILSSIEVLD